MAVISLRTGTGTKGVIGVEKTLYPSTNTTEIYVLPFRRADDGARRLIICSKLSVPLNVTLTGDFCANGKALAVLRSSPRSR